MHFKYIVRLSLCKIRMLQRNCVQFLELCVSVLLACKDDNHPDIIQNRTLLEENTRLHELSTLLHGRHHKMSMEVKCFLFWMFFFFFKPTFICVFHMCVSFVVVIVVLTHCLAVQWAGWQGNKCRDEGVWDGNNGGGPPVGYRETSQQGTEAEQTSGWGDGAGVFVSLLETAAKYFFLFVFLSVYWWDSKRHYFSFFKHIFLFFSESYFEKMFL